MLGAYFGSTKIVQGAGGLGQDGPLASYADGVFTRGDRADAETPGALFSFHDGSLGVAPLQAYSDGSVGGGYPEMDGGLQSFDDGIFGSQPAVEYEASAGGSSSGAGPTMPGASGGGGGNVSDLDLADHPAPIQAYSDGVFGGRGVCGLGDSDGPTPISVDANGILGRPFGVEDRMYGGLRTYHDGSLGAETATSVLPVLDLGDQATITEVKSLLGQSSAYALTPDGQKLYTADWYTSGIWEPNATLLWEATIPTIAAFNGKEVSVDAGNQSFPNGLAIAYLYGLYAAPAANAPGPELAAKNFPIITAWFLGKGTQVAAPYFSIADKTKGHRGSAEAGMSMTTMAMWGLGAAALLGVALVLTKKR